MTTIEAPYHIRVEVTAALEHLCPVVDERDIGTITIGWTCIEATLELHALTTYLQTWRDVRISHEDLVDSIDRYLSAQPGVRVNAISATFTTAGMTVTASA